MSKEAVSHYLKADHIYLNNFSDIYAVLISKTTETKLKKFFMSQINFIIEKEVIGAHGFFANYVGKDYLDIIKDGEMYPSADHYIKHIYYNLYKYGLVETLSAMLACPWIYKKFAEKILKNHKLDDKNPFKEWVEFYNGSLCDECIENYTYAIEKYSKNYNQEEKNRVIKIFLESCEHEKNFFDMSYKQEKWLHVCDCSSEIADIIYNMHNDLSITDILSDKSKPIKLLERKFNNE